MKNVTNAATAMNGQEKQVVDEDFVLKEVIQTLDELRKSKLLCDVTVRAEGQDFPAHQCVLSAGSRYFRALFTSELKVRESEHNLIELTEIPCDAFNLVLEYIYSGEVKISSSNVQDLVVAADYLIIPSLKSEACLFLEESMNVSNCLALETFASKFSCESLKKAAVTYNRENFVAVAKSKDFLSLDLQRVKDLLCDDKINVPQEEEVYEAMIGWVKHDLESRECFLAELLKCVRLFSMSKYSLRQILEEEELVKKSLDCMSIVVSGLDYFLFPDRFQGTSLSPRMSLGEYENVVVLTGGVNVNNQSLRRIHFFGVSAKTWLNSSHSIPDSYGRFHEAVVCGGLLYVVGRGRYPYGSTRTRIYYFKPKQNEWSSTSKSYSIDKDCSVTTFNEVLYVTGGENNWNRTQAYNPSLDEWKEVESMQTGRAGHCSIVLQKHIYVIAGHNGTECLNSVECYDPSTDQWKAIASISKPRRFAAAATSCGKILVVGGYSDMSDSLATEASCEIYDPSTNQWSLVSSPAFPRAACGIVSMDDKIYLFGGRNEEQFMKTVDCFDVQCNEWHEFAEMPIDLQSSHLRASLLKLPKKCLS